MALTLRAAQAMLRVPAGARQTAEAVEEPRTVLC